MTKLEKLEADATMAASIRAEAEAYEAEALEAYKAESEALDRARAWAWVAGIEAELEKGNG